MARLIRKGGIIASYIPRERILATPFRGFGAFGEKEVVVIGVGVDVGDDRAIVAATYRQPDDEVDESNAILGRIRGL